VASKHRGDSRDAIARFEALLSKYPGGPLSEQATAERMKLLRDVDRSRAIQAARAYLASYPNGFARADAEAIVATER
jgi:outer membrane protein assembly factor BamD (BamD/ComL family)